MFGIYWYNETQSEDVGDIEVSQFNVLEVVGHSFEIPLKIVQCAKQPRHI